MVHCLAFMGLNKQETQAIPTKPVIPWEFSLGKSPRISIYPLNKGFQKGFCNFVPN